MARDNLSRGLLSLWQGRELTGYSVSTLQKAIKAGELRVFRHGPPRRGRRRFLDPEELLNWALNRRRRTSAESKKEVVANE